MDTEFKIYLGILCISTIIGLVRFNHLIRPFRLLTLLLGFSFFSECLVKIAGYQLGFSNPVYHIYAPVSYLLYAGIFYSLLPSFRIMRVLILVSMYAIIPVALYNTLFSQPLPDFPSHLLLLNIILISTLSIISFYGLLKFPESIPILKNPVFWVLTGTLVFHAASFIYLGFDDIIMKKLSGEAQAIVSDVHFYFSLLMYFLYGVSLCIYKPAKHKPDSP